ncbi:MAG TPA: hypothetical protein VM532_00120 [Burkholderiales bacterium]|nr:hypothetical protein [Burkholderiales bacterium]
MPKPAYLRNIRRIDDARTRTYAWVVQVQRRNQVVIQYFTDNLFGGKEKALKAAMTLRDQLVEQMHDNRYPLWRRTIKRRNNTSGIVGVGRYVSRENVGNRIIERTFWQAFWEEGGRRHSRKFLVSKHGELGAKRLARETRRQAIQRVSGE